MIFAYLQVFTAFGVRFEVSECIFHMVRKIPAGIYLLKVINRNTRKRRKICLKLTIKTPSVVIVNNKCLYC